MIQIDTILMNSKNSKSSDPHKVRLNKNNTFRISFQTRNNKFWLRSGSYAVSDIKD